MRSGQWKAGSLQVLRLVVADQLHPLVGLALQVAVDQGHHPVGVRPAMDQVTDLDHHEVGRQRSAGIDAQPRELRTQRVQVPGHVADHRHPSPGYRAEPHRRAARAMPALAAALCRRAATARRRARCASASRGRGMRTEVRQRRRRRLCDLAAHPDVDAVMAAIVGAAGLAPCLAAARAGKRLLLANKEALVVGGALFMRGGARRRRDAAADRQRALGDLPVPAAKTARAWPARIDHIVLTASGGPFRDARSGDAARRHARRGLRASELGDGPQDLGRLGDDDEQGARGDRGALAVRPARPSRSACVIHPQSIIHSMVVCRDNSVLAQLGTPDMRVPIAYGLAFPERIESGAAPLDFATLGDADFRGARLRALSRACASPGTRCAAPAGSTAVLNAANEVAVAAFLAGTHPLRPDSQRQCRHASTRSSRDAGDAASLEALLELDARARAQAAQLVKALAA